MLCNGGGAVVFTKSQFGARPVYNGKLTAHVGNVGRGGSLHKFGSTGAVNLHLQRPVALPNIRHLEPRARG